MKLASFCLCFLATWTTALNAGLRWDATTVQHEMKLGEDMAQLSFAFSNPESRPITILHVNPGCGCTTAMLEKKTYAPGEKGKIEVVFDGRGRTGLQEKTIQVFSDDSPKPVTLTLRVTIPLWLEIKPAQLSWSVGEEPTPKEALITVHPGVRLSGDSLQVDGGRVEASWTAEEGGRRYRLVVNPGSTKVPLQAMVYFGAEIDSSPQRRFMIYAQVR